VRNIYIFSGQFTKPVRHLWT